MRLRMKMTLELFDEAQLDNLFHQALEVWRKTPFVFLEQWLGDFAVMINHPQAAMDSEVIPAQYILTAHREDQQHLGCPFTDAAQLRQLGDDRCWRLCVGGTDYRQLVDQVQG